MVSMVVNNSYFTLGAILPAENDPPLLVDANTPESGKIPLQLLQTVARGHLEILNDPCLIDHPKLAPGSFLDLPRQASNPQAAVDALSRRIAETLDHRAKIPPLWITSSVIRGPIYSGRRKAHPPLGAGTEVTHGAEVVVTENHVNRTAPSGWMRLVDFFTSCKC